MSILPKEFVDKHLANADTSLFRGRKFSEFSRDELIAICIAGWTAEKRARARARLDMETLFGMPKK